MSDEGKLERLETLISNLSTNLLRVETELKDFRILYQTVGSLKESSDRNERDISGAVKLVRETQSYMDQNKGGQKVLFWVIGLSFGAAVMFGAYIFSTVSSSARAIEDLKYQRSQGGQK